MGRTTFRVQVGLLVVLATVITFQGCARKTGAVQAGASVNAVESANDHASTSADSVSLDSSNATVEPVHRTADLADVHFDFDSALLRPDAQDALDSAVEWLRESSGRRLTLEGHADERGTNEYNLALAESRALAAKRYVVASGIDGQRIKTISYGEERPICRKSNESCYRQNRRTNLVEAH